VNWKWEGDIKRTWKKKKERKKERKLVLFNLVEDIVFVIAITLSVRMAEFVRCGNVVCYVFLAFFVFYIKVVDSCCCLQGSGCCTCTAWDNVNMTLFKIFETLQNLAFHTCN